MQWHVPTEANGEDDEGPDSLSAARGVVLGAVCGALVWLGLAALVACFFMAE